MPRAAGDKRKITATPSTKDFILHATDFVLRVLLTFNLIKKVLLYFVVVTFISLVTDLQRPGASYFSDKNNVFNQYFVKLGWGWTMTGVCMLILVTNLIEHKGHIKSIGAPAFRLGILTLFWYICTHMFEWLENFTGSCTNSSAATKRSCIREGFGWLGFDISGHCFILTLCLTVINEECQVCHKVSRLLDGIERSTESSLLSSGGITLTVADYRLYLRLVMTYLVFLTFLWEMMMVVTALYFHTTVQKLLGMIMAVLGWMLVYKIWKLGRLM